MITAEIELSGERGFLEACYHALEPEAEFKTERAHYKMDLGKTLKIKVEAQDATAFKAATTTLTGLLSVVEQGWKHGRK